MNSPLDILLPYQRAWVEDPARFKAGLMSRQVGKSFAGACEAVRDCLVTPAATWVVLSAGERQALEFMAKVRQWAEAFALVIHDFDEQRAGAEALLRSSEVRFATGSRVIALPANPATARGYSGNVILDEFAFHEDAEGIWRAIYPSITNPLRGELKLRVLSTPNGQGNRFYRLWTGGGANWSRHKVTVHDAIAAGLPINLDALREQIGDADAWAQEYECAFLDVGGVLFPYELIAGCESDLASELMTVPSGERGALYTGVDVGTVNDPTVAVTLERMPDSRLRVIEALRLKGMPLPDQQDLLDGRLAAATVSGLDATGLGKQMAQFFSAKLGGKFRPCDFTSKWKHEAFTRLYNALERKSVLLPVSRDVREDMHAWHVSHSGSGVATYWAPRTREGHSDFTSALVIALDCAATVVPGMARPFRNSRRGRALAARRDRSVAA